MTSQNKNKAGNSKLIEERIDSIEDKIIENVIMKNQERMKEREYFGKKDTINAGEKEVLEVRRQNDKNQNLVHVKKKKQETMTERENCGVTRSTENDLSKKRFPFL